MRRAVVEPAIRTSERPQTHTLDRAATGPALGRYTVIPWLTKIISSGITFVSRNLR